jgi:hypothetical protein
MRRPLEVIRRSPFLSIKALAAFSLLTSVAQRVSYVTHISARDIKGLCVAHVCRAVAGPPSAHRWTTAELWEVGSGWLRESKRQEHWDVSHGYWSCALETVPSPSWMYIYNVIYAVCSRSWQTHHRCASPIRGRRHHAPPQPRGAMGRGQDGQGPPPVGMAPSLIREHLFPVRTLRVGDAVQSHGRADPRHSATAPQRLESV